MNQRALFESWAPPTSIWSPWAKPVLFAHMRDREAPAPGPGPDCSWTSTIGPETALILDLPGAESVAMAAVLAHRGFRPVPLYNTTPGPAPVLVQVGAIMEALAAHAHEVARARLHDDAPPAFMLDSLRLQGARAEGAYDNRWAVFEQDFPSSTFMMSRGITQILLMAPHGGTSPDLARILSGWRRDGMTLLVRASRGTPTIEPLTMRTMINWRLAAFAAMLAMGLKRNATGGFGSRVPVSSSGTGGYG